MPNEPAIKAALATSPRGQWQAIPRVGTTPDSIASTVDALHNRSLTQSRETGNVLDSFVSVRDLVALGLIDAAGIGLKAKVEQVRWDDLKFPAQSINPPGQASDPDLEASTGCWLFAASGTELIFTVAQMPHAWKEGSTIVPHVHWEKTNDGTGDVAWRLRYKISRIGEVRDAAWTTLSTVTSTVDGTPDDDTDERHLITSFGGMGMSGSKISTCILFELSRVGGDAGDTYGTDARLLEFDVHYQIDSNGSVQEFVKVG